MASRVIEIDGVSCYSESGRVLFEDASLMLSEGERVLITAPVASGKAVIPKLIAGLVKPEKGSVRLFGKDISAIPADELNALRKRIGFIFHDSILISNLKVIENVTLPLLYHTEMTGRKAVERAVGLLSAAGFNGDVWGLPGLLPIHARKEVAIARALALGPDVIICESLTDGLTVNESEKLMGFLSRYQEEEAGRLLVFTSVSSAGSSLYAPTRVVRIEANRFEEG